MLLLLLLQQTTPPIPSLRFTIILLLGLPLTYVELETRIYTIVYIRMVTISFDPANDLCLICDKNSSNEKSVLCVHNVFSRVTILHVQHVSNLSDSGGTLPPSNTGTNGKLHTGQLENLQILHSCNAKHNT